MSDDAYDDDGAGYKKPPKRTRFKKGQSGCPDGGWTQRRARAAAKAQKAEAERLKQEKLSVSERFIAVARRKRLATIGGEQVELESYEVFMMRLQEKALPGDDPDAMKLYAGLLKSLGLVKPVPPPQARVGAVVLREPSRTGEAWQKMVNEGPQPPLNPLEGLPGYNPETGTLDGSVTRKRGDTPGEDED